MERKFIILLVCSSLIFVGNSIPVLDRRAPKDPSKLFIASVLYDPKSATYTIKEGPTKESYVARAEFTDSRYQYGWTFLTVDTNESYPDAMQAYAAGLAEGYMTLNVTIQHWYNTAAGYCNPDASSPYCQRLAKYIDVNFNQYIQRNIKALAKTDPYWHQVELFMIQLSGLTDGHNRKPTQPRTVVEPFGMLLFQINGDLEDLEVALNKPENLRKHVLGSGSCSALIKLAPNNKELFTAQDTWSTYQSMIRIIKRYDFSYHMLDKPGSELIPGNSMLFSSYPGNLYSGDDFYILESNLTVMETTIGNSNPKLNAFIQPEGTILEGIRNQIANRLARDGASWADIFSRYNSGTYNNEWMVVDYNKFTPGMKSLPAGLLTVLEQIPGMIRWDDVTPILAQQSYWASYNAAYFPEIFNASGVQAMVDKYGDWFTYDKTPRAQIFRRDHSKVVDETSMIKLMRYNDFQHDKLSQCNCTPPYSAENAISARSDLNPKNGSYPFGALGHRSHGGTDMKMTSHRLMFDMGYMMTAVSGPTHDDQPPFSWLTADFAADTPHVGHPDVWNFEPVTTNW